MIGVVTRHHSDVGYASLTFETFMTTPTPNSCIVTKRNVMRYQQTTVFGLFEENVKYHNFCVEALRYDKTNRDWRLDRYYIFSHQFVTCCPRSLISGNILRTSGQKFSIMTSTPVTICILVYSIQANCKNAKKWKN